MLYSILVLQKYTELNYGVNVVFLMEILSMARLTKPLTHTEISKAKSKDKAYSLFDGGGLELNIKANGSKQWLLKYCKPYTKNRTYLSLGKYPEISLANARVKRQEAKDLLADNIDPKEHRIQQEENKRSELGNTFESVLNEWFEIKQANISERQATKIIQSFKNHILPELGKRPISTLTPRRVIEVIKKPEKDGKLELAKRLCARVNEVMNYAANTGLIDINPLTGITKAFKNPETKHQPAVSPEKLPWLLELIANANILPITRHLMNWQLHTMVRPSEAAGAMWSEIDLENKRWNIPKERMKGKEGKRLPQVVPLTEQTIAILTALKPLSGNSDYIFPSRNTVLKPLHSETVSKALNKMGLQGIQTAHGFRRVASTTLNEKVFNPDHIEKALAHVDHNEVRRAYNGAMYLPERRKMMAWWSNHIEQCKKGVFNLCAPVTYLKQVNE